MQVAMPHKPPFVVAATDRGVFHYCIERGKKNRTTAAIRILHRMLALHNNDRGYDASNALKCTQKKLLPGHNLSIGLSLCTGNVALSSSIKLVPSTVPATGERSPA